MARGRRLRTPPFTALSEIEGRPVVFFRSFSDDGGVYPFGTSRNMIGFAETYEQVLARLLKKVGPPIAIGRPGEDAPELGAARIYVGDDEWKEVAGEMIQRAAMVIVTVGKTPGVRWEIEHVLKDLQPERLLFFFPPKVKRFARIPDPVIAVLWFLLPFRLLLLKDDRKERYQNFVSLVEAPLAELNPEAKLPKKLGNSLFISFDADWKPTAHWSGQLFPLTGPVFSRSLNPLLRRMRKMEKEAAKCAGL